VEKSRLECALRHSIIPAATTAAPLHHRGLGAAKARSKVRHGLRVAAIHLDHCGILVAEQELDQPVLRD